MSIIHTQWYKYSIEDIKKQLKTDLYKGLLELEVKARQKKYGENILEEEKTPTVFKVLVAQFKSPLVFVLLGAGLVTMYLKEYLDTIVIFIALSINVIIGAIQEERASKAFQKLKESQQKYATVIRSGSRMIVSAKELVPGDIIIIEQGMIVPADARILESNELSVNESALTGEWIDIEKDNEIIKKGGLHITEQNNMIWMGTVVTGGNAKAVIVATGHRTQVGAIASELAIQIKSQTPLQKNISKLAAYLTIIIILVIFIILILGYLRGEPLSEMFLIAIAIAVAAMPEGLPAAVAVVLALGMESILKKKGLVRNMLAAETLGNTTVILTDKTGTLTKATMAVAEIITPNSLGSRRTQKSRDGMLVVDEDSQSVLAMAVLTSDAFVEGYDDSLSEWVIRAKPMDKAIIKAGLESGIRKEKLHENTTEIDTILFESERRFTASLNQRTHKGKKRMYLKGAPELFLNNATSVFLNGKIIKLNKKDKVELTKKLEEKTNDGMRVLGIAFKDVSFEKFSKEDREDSSILLESIIFAGFVVIHDPIRPDAKSSIQKAKSAGARVIMVTGDNAGTARKVAEEVGIAPTGGDVIIGKEIMEMSDMELLQTLNRVTVFARVLPHQKMRLVQILKNNDEIVAMTGDGINDAPALRRADIGVALGSGTDVAKEASDLIILNNSFSVIVYAIEEGRRILDNLKKIIAYLLSTSFSEVFVVAGALAIGAPLPLLPAQILWTNIVEEGFMNFAFAFEPKEDGIMKRNPKSSAMQSIFTNQLRFLIIILSLISGVFLTTIYFALLKLDMPIEKIRTIMFMVLSIDSIFFSFSLKDLNRPVWRISILSNLYLVAAMMISLMALLGALYLPFLQKLLSLTQVTPKMIGFGILVGIINLLIIEVVKFIYNHKKGHHKKVFKKMPSIW